MTMNRDLLAENATVLLLAHGRGDESAGQQYVELLYPHIHEIVRRRPSGLLGYARRLLSQPDLDVADVPERDLDDLAQDVALHALARATRAAGRFDPARGDGFSWALTAAAYSYLDVVRTTYGSRRRQLEVLLDDDQFAMLERQEAPNANLEQQAEQRERLLAVLALLTPDERYVLLAKLHHGLSYVEIAQYLFGSDDARTVRRVGKLLERARTKVRAAEQGTDADSTGTA